MSKSDATEFINAVNADRRNYAFVEAMIYHNTVMQRPRRSDAQLAKSEANVSLSQEFVEREIVRSHRFEDIWKTLIPEVFRDVPTYYDRGNAVASLGSCARWSDRFADAVAGRLVRGSKLLDVCTGTHDIPLRLLKHDPTIRVDAVDGSRHMIAEGQRRARENNLVIHAQVCDAHALPFPDNSFDAVTLQFATRHLRIVPAFQEIRRVLKPGGLFCHNDMLRPASRIVEVPYLSFLRFSVWSTAKLFGSSPEAMKCIGYFTDAIRHFYTPAEMSGLLSDIGFEGLEERSFLTGVMSYHISRKPMR